MTGALPLIHTKCCVFKVHGDYLDTRIRNSPAELQRYPQEFNQLLDRIFDEFGLIVCGWSAEWDSGLRDAILRCFVPTLQLHIGRYGETLAMKPGN